MLNKATALFSHKRSTESRNSESQTQKSITESRNSESQSQKSITESRNSESQSQKSITESRNSESQSQKSSTESSKSESQSQKSSTESSKSESQSQKSITESRNSESQSQKKPTESRNSEPQTQKRSTSQSSSQSHSKLEFKLEDSTIYPEEPDKKMVVMDLKVKLGSGESINIEVQTSHQHGFTQKILFYLAKLFTADLQKGKDFDKIQPAYSLVFTTFSLFDEFKEHLSSFSMIRETHPHVLFSYL